MSAIVEIFVAINPLMSKEMRIFICKASATDAEDLHHMTI